MSNPRIYVACLSSYNAGKLHGSWFDLSDYSDADELGKAVAAMLATSTESPAEEWAIHDHEGFCGIEISEYAGLDRVVEIAQALSQHEDEQLVSAAVRAFGDEWVKALTEGYRGAYEHEGDYAYELATECHAEAELGPFANYIDWARMERDYELNGDITVVTEGGTRHVFTSF